MTCCRERALAAIGGVLRLLLCVCSSCRPLARAAERQAGRQAGMRRQPPASQPKQLPSKQRSTGQPAS
jgi:hypothetical protein